MPWIEYSPLKLVFEPVIPLSRSLRSQDYKCGPPCPAFKMWVLGTKLRSVCVQASFQPLEIIFVGEIHKGRLNWSKVGLT